MKKSNPFLRSVRSYLQSEMFLSNSVDMMKNLQGSYRNQLIAMRSIRDTGSPRISWFHNSWFLPFHDFEQKFLCPNPNLKKLFIKFLCTYLSYEACSEQIFFSNCCGQATWCHLATVVCHFLSNCVSFCNFCNYRIQVWSKTLSTISKKTPKQKPILFLLSYCSIFGDI